MKKNENDLILLMVINLFFLKKLSNLKKLVSQS